MQLSPYVFFYGRCEEALAFYKDTLGGSYEIRKAENGDGVMHATFNGPGFSFMASDGMQRKTIDPDAGNITLSLATGDAAEGARVFAALAQGGTITMALDDVAWGGKFGMAVDRFGIEWMMSTQ